MSGGITPGAARARMLSGADALEQTRTMSHCRCTGSTESHSQCSTFFEIMSRSKRKRWTRMFPGTVVLFVILLCLFPSITLAQDRAATDEISLFVDENQPPGTIVGTVAKANEDRTINSYTFLSSSPPQEFHLNRTNGIITTTVRIDRETLSNDLFQLPITISFQDGATEVVELSILVNDFNDNSPEFPQPSITVSFSENADIGSRYILPSAMDADRDANGYIAIYNIIDGNEDDVFVLQTFRPREDAEYTVELTTAKLLDRESTASYALNISATDNGTVSRTGYLTVNVSIDDVNDNTPLFSPTTYRASVNESSAAGTMIIRLEATDIDQGSNGEVIYSLKSPSDDFTVDAVTGWVMLQRQLPYMVQGYNVEIVARDKGVPSQSSNAFLTVFVEDENDHSPEITISSSPDINSNGFVRLEETVSQASFVFSLRVTDQDSGISGMVDLVISSGNEHSDFSMSEFRAQSDLYGIFSVSENANIDRELTSSYNITFKATDRGTPPQSSYRSIIIYIEDENDHAPEFTQESYVATLDESVQPGSYVQSVTAADADVGLNAAIIYSITGDDYGWFTIDNETGLVTTRSKLDYEQASQVTLIVTASDQGTIRMTNTTTLIVNIQDVNDEYPVFDQTFYNITVVENASPMDLIQVSADDLDDGIYGDVTFALGNGQYESKFSVGASTGMLSTLVTLDREDAPRYEVEIIASDGGIPPLVSTATVIVHVLDVNDNLPIFYPVEYYANVIENGPVGLYVTSVAATDPDGDINGAITYTLSNTSRFVIDSTSGNITTLESLDREEEPSYTLVVGATDGGGLTSLLNAIVHVLVTDTQDNPLIFQQNPYRFQLEENRENNSLVGTVKATSPDLNVDITYVIAGGDQSNLFSIDTFSGVINTTRSIDREAQASDFYYLTVYAVDGSQNGQTIVEVEILDINDNAPTFSVQEDRVDVVENWAVGYEFYAVQVSDADNPPNNIILYDLSQNVDGRFDINHTSGVLFINKDLQNYPDREYNLQIRATDYGTPPLSSSFDLYISVRDVNNHAPVFADSVNTSLKLMESIAVNSQFIQTTATDADEGTNGEITYRIADGNQGESFGIFPDGVIYVKRALDRETIENYALQIEARDGGVPALSSSVTLDIEILDVNDNRPFFQNATYNFFLSEEQSVGAIVGRIQAIDNDVNANGLLTYSFASNHTQFTLNSGSGVIRSTVTLDREALVEAGQSTTFTARVRVHDNGAVQLQDYADVYVHISDLNDNAPVFQRDFYQASVSELALNETLIIRVSATDKDIGDNAYISYSIVSGNDQRKFHIDHMSGQIILRDPLDREITDQYVLTVKARDSGVISQESFVQVEIAVLDENDHRPSFLNAMTEFEVTECLQIGDSIGFVHATDRDENSNGRIFYTITGGNLDGVFGVNPLQGNLYLTGLLDHEATSQYHLNITASDGGSPSLSSGASFVINIRDCNDNSPVFAYVGVPAIDEEVDIGYPVVRVQGSDSDSGVNGEIRFSILKQQPSGGFFTIDPESGWVTTNRTIDREAFAMSTVNFELTILATDLAIPVESRRTASVEVVVFVRDINDNAPTFTSQQAAILSRSAEANTKVATIQAEDPDAGVNGDVTYTLVTNGVPFRLDLNSGDLTLTQAITSQSPTKYTLQIRAQDAGSNPQQQRTTSSLTVIISDGQSSDLAFALDPYSNSIRENQAAGTVILTVFARYTDGRTAALEYFVASVTAGGQDMGSLIVADPSNGVIRTGAVLDREALGGGSSLTVTVYAVDTSSSSSQVRSAQIDITVLDENDNAPVFNLPSYNVSIAENSPVGSAIETITASDADLGSNSRISYAIVEGATDVFLLDATTGALSTRAAIDRETASVYRLVVRATDGTQSSTTTVDVHLVDENDNDPLFSESTYSFLVPEDEEIAEMVGVIVATDPDAGSNGDVVYSLVVEGAPGEDVFSLDPTTGAFSLLQTLDYETKQLYHLTVKATDRGSSPRSATARVYINVEDINDNDPMFDPISYSEELSEDVDVGTPVVVLSATDFDSGVNGELQFSIMSGDPSQRFTVLPDGTLVTAKPLDREEESFYNLEVVASDSTLDPADRRSSTAQVSIIVTDINDNAPRFMNADSVSIAESTREDVIIMVLFAVDNDVERNSYVEFSLLTPSVPFTVDRTRGNVQVSGPLDRETQASYTLLVQATDLGTPPQSSTMNVTIYLMDVNDNAPVFNETSYRATLVEGTPVGLEFLRVAASDPDEGLNAIIRYTIFSGNANQAFAVDPASGVMSVNSDLNYEARTSYSLTVRAQDLGDTTRITSVNVVIDITDINDNMPIFLDNYAPSIAENNLPNADVVRVSASDADSGANGLVTYRLSADFGGLFSIGSTSGQITVTGVLDYETITDYELVVIAEDAGSPSHQTSTRMTLTVTDENDHDPSFLSDLYRATVAEDASPDTFVIQVTATDADSSSDLRYQLNDDVGSKFTIDPLGGRILTSGVLDRETRASYQLTVTVNDGPTRQATTSVYVEVTDANDNPPRFPQASYSAVLPATSPQGRFVAAVQATDADLGNNAAITYSITSGDTNKFTIDVNTGVVSTAQGLNNENSVYDLQITAQNVITGQSSATATLHVEFSSASFPVITSPASGTGYSYNENAQSGTSVATVVASGGAAYSIAGGNFGDYFEVDSQSGVLRIAKSFDYEDYPFYSLWIQASEGSSPPLSDFVEIRITVTDDNDNAPIFTHTVYSGSVVEEQANQVEVLTVSASDLDSDVRGSVTYSIESGNTNNAFRIDPSSGTIATRGALDRESVSSYLLTVVGTDGGAPARSGSASVVIAVGDINDNRMSFTRIYDATIPENAPPGTHVVTVHTTDPDENNLSQFTLESGGSSSLFSIDQMTGQITLNNSLDYEDEPAHYLLIRAYDSVHAVQTEVTVNVQDVNDNTPEFKSNMVEWTYPESFFTDNNDPVIFNYLSATDGDSGDNGEIEFVMKTLTDLFEVGTTGTTGWIYYTQPISYIVPTPGETSDPNEYLFGVFAVDHGIPSRYSEATVTIHVTQSRTPGFEEASYFSPVTANTPRNTQILQVVAKDLSTGSSEDVTYSITEGNGTSKFDVEADTGWVTNKVSLVGDIGTIYQIKVTASADSSPHGNTANTTVTLVITDINAYPPTFTDQSYDASVAENVVSAFVITVQADDDDEGVNGDVRYYLQGSDAPLFSIEERSGVVSVIGSLDREASPQHQLKVVAEDRAMYPMSATATLTITVTDVDDNAPVFDRAEYTAEVFENSPTATPVVTVLATDADIGPNAEFTYAIYGDIGDINFFTIDEDTGTILTQGNLDYEAGKTTFLLTVEATNDDDTKVGQAHVVVTLLGRNEFYPQFTQHSYDMYVNEHAADGSPVGMVLATDGDLGVDGNVYYLLIGGSNSQGFAIDYDTGFITVAEENGLLDRETADTVTLSVLAKNDGPITGDNVDEAEVIIHIQDGNDAPVFTSIQYQARINENAEIGDVVTTVTAQDYDEEPSFRQFSYSILEGNAGDAFDINAGTGNIKVASGLDRESIAVYYLTVAAIDTGTPPQTGTAVVIVQLDDTNDNGPVFEGTSAEGSVSENQPSNAPVMTLNPTDPDENSNPALFSFTLLSSADSSAFRLVGNELRTTRTLDREAKADYYIQVQASDGEIPPITAVSTIHIAVADRNDNSPSPRQAHIEVKMFQSSFAGGAIGSVQPIDIDVDDTFSCRITSGDSSKFTIQSGCNLFSGAHSTESQLALSVSGDDGVHESVTSTFTVVYESFTSDTVSNSVTLRIAGTSAETFLSQSYDLFKTSLSGFLSSSETIITLGIVDYPDINKVDLILAVKKQGGLHVLKADLINLLSTNKATLESEAGITIQTVDYTACSDSPCLNNGICSGSSTIDYDLATVESNPVVLVGIQISHDFTCYCQAEYSGPVCEIPTDYCKNSNCLNGATCQNQAGGFNCSCAAGYTGIRCELEINECASNPCQNGGACEDLDNSFFCSCPSGYTGIICEIGPCSTNPCENDGTCTESSGTFRCECDADHWGTRCEYDTIGFQGGSFMSRPALPSTGAVVMLEFATSSSTALLFYNHDSFTNANARFVALEILEGRLQLSFNFGSGRTSIAATKMVNDGLWHRVEVRLEGTAATLTLLDEDCPRLATDACSVSIQHSISLNFDSTPLTVGGVPDITEVTSRAAQVSSADFVGCMNGVYINGERLSPATAQESVGLEEGCSREGATCAEAACPGGACVDEWWNVWCQCDAASCADAYTPVSFGGGSYVTYRVKESYKRQAMLNEAKTGSGRRKRATGSESVSLSFRTGIKDGLLLYIASDSEFTTLQLKNGSVLYSYGDYGATRGEIAVATQSLSDWEWHDLTLTSTGGRVTVLVDETQEKSATFADPHAFTALSVTGMWLGGTEDPVDIDGRILAGFSGCLENFQMNGEPLPLDGDTERFEAVPSSTASKGCSAAGPCASNPCSQGEACLADDTGYTCSPTACTPGLCLNGATCAIVGGMAQCTCPSGFTGNFCETTAAPSSENGNVVVYVVVPLVIILILIVVALGLVYMYRKRRMTKNKKLTDNPTLQQQVVALNSTDNPAFMGDTFDDATMIGSNGKVDISGLIQRATPDIIEQNMALQQNNSNPSSNSLMMENDTGEHVNIEMELRHSRGTRGIIDELEHYDLENASSIAASDTDVAYHYKHYHDNGRNRKKKKHRMNQNPLLARIEASPARLSPIHVISRNSPNPMLHSTPLEQNQLLRQSPGLMSNYSTKNTLRMGSNPNSGRATPARSIASPVNSEQSYKSDLRSQAHHSDVSSLPSVAIKPARVATPLSHTHEVRVRTPLSHESSSRPPSRALGRQSKSPVVGLTAEEVAQLNTARPDLMTGSQASTMDNLSSNDSHKGHHRHPHAILHTPTDPHYGGRSPSDPHYGVHSPSDPYYGGRSPSDPHYGGHTPNIEPQLLEPPDSTSDDTNDSFTCSEMDDDQRDVVEHFNTESVILTRLAEIEDAQDSMLPQLNNALTQKRLDSRGGSLSTLFTSEDENGQPRRDKRVNGDVSLERLLGWGPKFDNLVGVFKDIAQLHENNGKIALNASLTHEEFV